MSIYDITYIYCYMLYHILRRVSRHKSARGVDKKSSMSNKSISYCTYFFTLVYYQNNYLLVSFSCCALSLRTSINSLT